MSISSLVAQGWTELTMRMSYAGFDALERYVGRHFDDQTYYLAEVKGVEWNDEHNCQKLQVHAFVRDANAAFEVKLRFHGS